MTRRSPSLAASTFVLTALLLAPVRAQDSAASGDKPSIDQLADQTLREGKGIVILDALLTKPGPFTGQPLPCLPLSLTIAKSIDDQVTRKTLRAKGKYLGKTTFRGMTDMPPGEYLLLSITCEESGKSNYSGPHARFLIRRGEVVNAGTLHIHYENTNVLIQKGRLHRSIEDLSPDAVSVLRERAPRTVARMVKRPMVMVGPPDIETQLQPCGIFRKCGP